MFYNVYGSRLKPRLSKFANRCAELNRREVDEKAEHLRLISWITGLITGFTMTNPVEFSYDSAVSTVHELPPFFCDVLHEGIFFI